MKNNRYKMVEVKCAVCPNTFMARATRVRDGLGKYCSKECSYVGRNEIERKKWGRKDLARKYKVGGRLCARWYDENGKTCSTSYQRWWWEMNVGEIPDGMIVLLKDNDPLNIDPSNLILGTKKDATDKGKETIRKDKSRFLSYIESIRKSNTGHPVKKETRDKISKANAGRIITNEQRVKIGNRTAEMWRSGFFDKIHKGSNSWKWRGGVDPKYPKEFNEDLKNFIKSRDNYQCQICSHDLRKSRNARIHHRDRNKENNDQNNLILLCKYCHNKVHSKSQQSPPIMALREEML